MATSDPPAAGSTHDPPSAAIKTTPPSTRSTPPMPRHACDLCRQRKIKCVRTDTGCAFCTSIGMPCRTAPRQRVRSKVGLRGRARANGDGHRDGHGDAVGAAVGDTGGGVDASQRDWESVGAGVHGLEDASAAPKRTHLESMGSASNAADATPAAKRHRPDGTGNAHVDTATTRNLARTPGARLLGVPGLTRQALDICIATFFTTVGRVFHLSEPQAVFSRRVRVHLYYASGLDVPAELAGVADRPASELLILAVACRGAPFSPYANLVEALNARCCAVVAEPDALTSNGLDAVEAVALLAEQYIRPRLDAARTLTLDPLGKGGVVDLLFHHGLNVPPPPDAPDYLRRQIVFWTVWVHDAIRSASAQTLYRIADDDIGWPPAPDPDVYPFMSLTRVTRQMCRSLLSPRAKARGLADADVREVLRSLAGLKGRLKVSVEGLEACVAPDAGQDVPTPMNGTRPMGTAEQLFLLSTHRWLHLVAWVAVLEDQDREHEPWGDPAQLLSPSTAADVEAAAMAACEDMARLAALCTQHELHVHAPKSIRNHMAAFVLFLVRVFRNIRAPTLAQSSQYFALGDTLNRGVRSARLYPDSQPLAETLSRVLYQSAPVGVRDAARVAEGGLGGLRTQRVTAPGAQASESRLGPLPTESVRARASEYSPHPPPSSLTPGQNANAETPRSAFDAVANMTSTTPQGPATQEPSPASMPGTHVLSSTASPQTHTTPTDTLGVHGLLSSTPFTSTTSPNSLLHSAPNSVPPWTPEFVDSAQSADTSVFAGITPDVPPADIDWAELMENLTEYGFDLPFVPL